MWDESLAAAMARILIPSGPTREYLDPVRYLTNASSGRMGSALAAAALGAGHEVVVVSGPVDVGYPPGAKVVPVITTEEMLAACAAEFPHCDGLIGAAAPCDYRPLQPAKHKLRKAAGSLKLELIETRDVLAALGESKGLRWMVAFALETEDEHMRALQKLERKNCDLIVLNGPGAIHSSQTEVEVLDPTGNVAAKLAGPKEKVAQGILDIIARRLIRPRP